jgi:O-antigen biosynthesis protein WbqP
MNLLKKAGWACVGFAGAFAVCKGIAAATQESGSIDDDNPYLAPDAGEAEPRRVGVYEKSVKPALDSVLSFGGMAALLPAYLAVAAAIYIDDPGPVSFKQKRIGKDKHYFMLHKFRTMKMSTPHDVPTHLLKDPEQYITRVGGFARRFSVDELAQLWDVFRGRLSLVGPRPALWNQDDLMAERERYGVNDVKPGITGWAQINGRDELSIEEKARFDGEYAKALKAGGWTAFWMDVRCLFGTFFKVLRQEDVHEGGPGAVPQMNLPAGAERELAAV